MLRALAITAALLAAGPAEASRLGGWIELEAGPAWQSRNDIPIPADTGTRFSQRELGSGPSLAARGVERHPALQLRAGYRTVEGGADGTGGVYSFAWLHYAVAGLSVRL